MKLPQSEKAKKTLGILGREFPGARGTLVFNNPLELLVATILSAQTTDKLVNTVTGTLFRKYKTASDYGSAPLEEIERAIGRVNFFRNKAKSIKGCCRMLADEWGGGVPDTLEALVALPGVGRKTANIVLGNAFGKDALAVDTHVRRVAGRLGLTASDVPGEIEKDLCAVIPKTLWTQTTHLFILHGRKTCKAKRPLCGECPVRELCDYYAAVNKGGKTG
ncbi:MAG: endonuclease III [Deltaproteobacteria bacterium]|nr:endonuclease III [Deltaproteobacteria bacterium]